MDVSRETSARLETLVDLVRKWSPKINLVSRSTLDQIWHRHIADSLQLLTVVEPAEGHWVDLGSGGGFPGVVCAIAAQQQDLPIRFTLVEADQRKATFLREALRKTETHASLVTGRAEQLAAFEADILSARALAPLPDLLGFADHHLLTSGRAIFPKGANWKKEVDHARETWCFDFQKHKSCTDPQSVILEISGLEPR